MDIVAPPPTPEPTVQKKKFDWTKLKKLRKVLPSRKVVVVAGVLVVVIAIAGGIAHFVHSNAGPLPASVVKSVSFPLYYPASLPDGYSYQQNSAKIENGFVFYSLQNGDKNISVSEQKAPSDPPDLTHLMGFTSLNTLAGNAVTGTNFAGQPSAIIISNTTMITITGQQGLPSDIVSQIAQNMRSLP